MHRDDSPRRRRQRRLALPASFSLPPGAIPSAPRKPGQPPWVPGGVDFDRLPADARQALTEIIEPAYEQIVRRAPDGLEKSLGLSVTHLLWLEVLDQLDLAHEYQTNSMLNLPTNRQGLIEQHLRVIASKIRVGELLVRLRDLRQRQATRLPTLEATPAPAPPAQTLDKPLDAEPPIPNS